MSKAGECEKAIILKYTYEGSLYLNYSDLLGHFKNGRELIHKPKRSISLDRGIVLIFDDKSVLLLESYCNFEVID